MAVATLAAAAVVLASSVPSRLFVRQRISSRAISAYRLSRQFAEKRKIKSEYARVALRLSLNEEANTQYGIGSRGSVRVGTGF